MAKAKVSGFHKNVLAHVHGAGKILAGAWRFVPLCADTAGGWDDAAVETIAKCATSVDVSRRGHVEEFGGKRRLVVASPRQWNWRMRMYAILIRPHLDFLNSLVPSLFLSV